MRLSLTLTKLDSTLKLDRSLLRLDTSLLKLDSTLMKFDSTLKLKAGARWGHASLDPPRGGGLESGGLTGKRRKGRER